MERMSVETMTFIDSMRPMRRSGRSARRTRSDVRGARAGMSRTSAAMTVTETTTMKKSSWFQLSLR